MKFIKKLFECNEKQTKYWIPIAKMLGAAAIVALFVFSFLREGVFIKDNLFSTLMIDLACAAATVSVIIIIISLVELWKAWYNNHHNADGTPKAVRCLQLTSLVDSIMGFIKKLFTSDEEQTKYWIPITKMLGSAAIIAFSFLQGDLLSKGTFLMKLLFYCMAIATLACIYLFLFSLLDLTAVWENNHPKADSALKPVKYQQQAIVKMACDNDIIEFKVWLNEKAVKLGSSSDYDRKTDKFFDKLYYIGKAEYKTAIEFADAMHEVNGNKGFDVISIDGVPASKY